MPTTQFNIWTNIINPHMQKQIQLWAIHATFTKTDEQEYDVSLNISSQKFFLHISEEKWSIEWLDIISSKSFLEINKESIMFLKIITETLLQNNNII